MSADQAVLDIQDVLRKYASDYYDDSDENPIVDIAEIVDSYLNQSR